MKRVRPVLVAIVAMLMSITGAMAQRSSRGDGELFSFFSNAPLEFWFVCMIGLICLIVIVFLLFFLNRVQNRKANDIAGPVIIVMIVFAVLILSTIGLRNEQIAPAFALFGTIVGYLLGRLDRSG